MTFRAPVKAMSFLFHHAVDSAAVMGSERFSEVNAELVTDILSGAASFSEDVLAPTNWDGDQNPAQLDGDVVTTSPGFKEAYASYVEAGWQGLSAPAEIGGMDLPQSVSVCANEMIYAANMAFGLCPMLTASAMKAIHAHASDELKETYLSKMVTGEWSGAMNLTEPQAGSDLGVLRAKAEPNGDGTYAVSGQKIYITWGEHDCAENIVHLVLARLPDAPEGSRGISLFLCPKYFVEADGALGTRNTLKAIGLEHKLGIHGSPTCVMEFEKATGWLVGEPNRGLAAMFTMMNEARLFVGVQGVAIGERAYQAALAYAEDRVQGRAIGSENRAGDLIIEHPDVRRMLIDMKARLMAGRAINLATAVAGDIAVSSADEDIAKAAHAREALLTPIAKSYGSDTGVDVSSIGVQVHGGMGFVEETGAAQHYRDSRIAPIYEGTNGIQAMDLIGRKLRRDGGEAMRDLITDIRGIGDLAAENSELSAEATAIDKAANVLTEATDIMLKASDVDALSGATAYLDLTAKVYGGALLVKATANGLAARDEDAAAMGHLARYHTVAVMPKAAGHLDFIRAGAPTVFDFPKTALADL